MAIIQQTIEYLLPGGTRRKRSIRYDDVADRDSLEFFAPDLETRLTDIDTKLNNIRNVLPSARGQVSSANSLSVTSSQTPLEARDPIYQGNGTFVVNTTLGGDNLIVDVSRMKRFSIELANTTGGALTAFEVATRCHPNGNFRLRYSTSTHYNSIDANAPIRQITDLAGGVQNPFTLPAGLVIIIDFDVQRQGYIHELRFRASKSTSAGNMTFLWGGS